jgi:hypothetical protein
MSFSEFTNNKNKGVLWGLLQEGGIFNNIPASMFQNVKHIFEMSILSMKPDFDLFFENNDEGDDDYDKKAASIIVNSNKLVIKKVIDEVNRIKMQNENSARQTQVAQAQTQAQTQAQAQQNSLPIHLKPLTPTPLPTKKPKIEEIYRADDIKKTRMSELEIRLKEKQTEMDIMLNNKKPEHIDFSDKALGINKDSELYDKKLAGDEMERLLAEALASRERELEKLNIDAGGHGRGGGGDIDSARIPVNKIITKRPYESKNVTFNDADNTMVEYENQVNETQEYDNSRVNTDNPNDNVLSFFSKLKSKKGNVDTNSGSNSGSSSIPLDDIMNSRSDNENENDNHNHGEGMQLKVHEVREVRELREMQKYVILEQRIKSIHDDMVEIKKNQELILSLLEKKLH